MDVSVLPPVDTDVTRLLEILHDGGSAESEARDALYDRVYAELHALAGAQRARWQGNATLNTTAIVHEAFLKLAGGEGRYDGRAHFMAVACKAMRHVLYSYAQRQAAQKRGGGQADLSLDESILVPPDRADSFVALEDALVRLEALDGRAAQVVECRFFGGLTVEETAQVLGTSPRTVARDWIAARTWLYGELKTDVGIGEH
ncbi:MAG: ECF-type sigma factor [Rubricoccaceae bacterium]